MKILKRVLIVICSLAIIAIAAIFIVNQFTVTPYFKYRRFVEGEDNCVVLDSYENQVKEVEKTDELTISPKGYPAANVSIFDKKSGEKKPLLVFVHGGGWCKGTAAMYEDLPKLYASFGFVAADVDYSLAPENPYPAALMQLTETVNYLYENADDYGIDKDKIFICGISSGAHMAAMLGGMSSNPDYAKEVGADLRFPLSSLRGLILYDGIYDMYTFGESDFPEAKKMLWAYTGQKDYMNSPYMDQISPVKYINDDYPSTYIIVASMDPINGQSEELREEIKKHNVDLANIFTEQLGMKVGHGFICNLTFPVVKSIFESTVEYMNKRCEQ